MDSDFRVYVECMTYNQERFISDALRGFVSQQTSFPFVVVIVDDASTDRSPDVIRTFMTDYFRMDETGIAYSVTRAYGDVLFARHQSNSNCYFAFVSLRENHYGQNKSKWPYVAEWMDRAEYIAFCEGDDYWTDPTKLEKQVSFLDEHPDFVMCCSAFSQTLDGQEDMKEFIVMEKDEITIEDITRGIWIGTMTTIFRKDAMRDYRAPFPGLPMGDLPLWCHLALKGKVKYMTDVTSNYRRLTNSASHFVDEKKQFVFDLSAMRVREYYARQSNCIEAVKRLFAKKAHFCLETCYKNRWLDFPLEQLWHFVTEYGHPSGYDKIRYWGLQNAFTYRVSSFILSLLDK